MSNSSRNQDTYQQHVGGWSRILANELSGAHSCGFSAPHSPTAAPPTTHTMQQFIYLITHWRTNRRDGRNGWLPWICLTASAWITSNKSPATAGRRGSAIWMATGTWMTDLYEDDDNRSCCCDWTRSSGGKCRMKRVVQWIAANGAACLPLLFYRCHGVKKKEAAAAWQYAEREEIDNPSWVQGRRIFHIPIELFGSCPISVPDNFN